MKCWAAILFVFLTACMTTTTTRPHDSLQKIGDDVWMYWLDRDISLRMKFGLPIEHLPDITFAEAQRDADFARTILKRLDAVQPANEEERLTAAILRWSGQRSIDAVPLFWYRFPVTPYRTPLFAVHNALTRMKLDTADAVRRYDRLLDEMPRFANDTLDILREQERRGIRLPKDEIATVRGMLASFDKLPDQSPFALNESRLAQLEPQQRERAISATRDRIAQAVNPSFKHLLAHFDDDYAAQAPAGIGLGQYPGGAEAYRAFVREETTTNLTPEAIHELGLHEIARIDRQLDAIRQEVGFSGSLAEFRRFLKTDIRFFATTPEEVASRLMSHVRRIEPQVPRFFARTPKAPYGVKRLDPELEEGTTFGYYQVPTAADPVGTYYFNGSKLSERNLLFAAALIAHELVPGHHFQIARQEENESLPPFRREMSETAYVEGWGEYAAYLATEMGLYQDPYDRAGRLMMDAMLSTRLVVDTGMNALGWPRRRAMEYMRENTMLSETEIATETLRYAVDIPAQALAYKIGSLKMIELRALAQRELGARFDVRRFHEWIIGSGSLPLPLLEEHVRHEMNASASSK